MDDFMANRATAEYKNADGEKIMPSTPGWRMQGPALAVLGYELVPIKPGTKRPNAPGWQKRDFNSVDFDRTFSRFGVGVKGSKTPGLDLDIADEAVCRQMVDWCRENIGVFRRAILTPFLG